MAAKGLRLLQLSFILGGTADALVAVNWMLIALGAGIPNLLSGYVGSGVDYRFAMYISTMFMAGWSMILYWGFFDPLRRRGLLLITAALLLLSILLEWVFYTPMLGGSWFLFGTMARIALIAKFSFSYFYSRAYSRAV